MSGEQIHRAYGIQQNCILFGSDFPWADRSSFPLYIKRFFELPFPFPNCGWMAVKSIGNFTNSNFTINENNSDFWSVIASFYSKHKVPQFSRKKSARAWRSVKFCNFGENAIFGWSGSNLSLNESLVRRGVNTGIKNSSTIGLTNSRNSLGKKGMCPTTVQYGKRGVPQWDLFSLMKAPAGRSQTKRIAWYLQSYYQ